MWHTIDLNEAQRISLFNAGDIKVVEKGEYLFRKGENGKAAYFVLGGLLAASGKGDGFRFKSDDWVTETDPSTLLRTSSVRALEPSKVLVVNDASFEGLPADVQGRVLKRFNHSALRRLSELRKAYADAESKRAKLSAHMCGKLRSQSEQYEKSDLIVNIINGIPRLPLHITELIQTLLDDNVSAKQASEVAKKDPSMVSEILKTVNSARYGLQRKVSDLSHAIMYLGFNEVYQIAMSAGLRKTMPDSEQFRTVHFHSLILSHISFELCQLHDRKKANIASTIAILHDLGKSVLYLLEKQNPKSAVFIRLLDPAKIGAMLLRFWNIPEILCQTVELQPYPYLTPPPAVPSEYRDHTAILYLAHAAYDFLAKRPELEQEHPFFADYMAHLNLRQSLDEIVNDHILKNLRKKSQMLTPEVNEFLFGQP